MNLPYNLYGNDAYYPQYPSGQITSTDPSFYQNVSQTQPIDNDSRILNSLPGLASTSVQDSEPLPMGSMPDPRLSYQRPPPDIHSQQQHQTLQQFPQQQLPQQQLPQSMRMMPPLQTLAPRLPQQFGDQNNGGSTSQPMGALAGGPVYGLMPTGNMLIPLSYQLPYHQYVGPFSSRSYDTDGPVSIPAPPQHHHMATGQSPTQLQPIASHLTTQVPTPSSAPSGASHSQSPLPSGYAANIEPTLGREYSNEYGETYKPLAPKKNSKPRIKKLDKSGSVQKEKGSTRENTESEPSGDAVYQEFLSALRLEKPNSSGASPAFFDVGSELEKRLFDLFIHEVSKSMNMFMAGNFFSELVPEMALLDETGMIMSSMFSLSALMLQRIDPDSIESSVPIDYYHSTIQSISHSLSLPSGDDNEGIIARCLVSTILLGVYEMFFLATDNTYVKGAVSLLTSIIAKSDDQSPLKNSQFLQMCFWAMFICDLILSLKFNLPAMFSVKQFWMQIDPQFVEQFTSPVYPAISPRPDDVLFISQKDAVWWLHRVLFDFSIANEFNSEVVVLTEKEFNTNKSFHDWLAINETLEDFERNLPQALKPIIYKPSSNDPNDSYYPTIYYRDELAAMIALHMKLTKVSLYQGLLQKTNLNSPEVQGYLKQIPRNHAKLLAKDVIGILRTYDLNTYLWPINIHTIRYVSRYLHDDEYEYKELEFFMKRVIETCHFIFQSKKIIG